MILLDFEFAVGFSLFASMCSSTLTTIDAGCLPTGCSCCMCLCVAIIIRENYIFLPNSCQKHQKVSQCFRKLQKLSLSVGDCHVVATSGLDSGWLWCFITYRCDWLLCDASLTAHEILNI